MTPRRAWPLSAVAAACVAGHAAFLPFQPFNRHVPAFLAVYSALCLVLALFMSRARADDDGAGFKRDAFVVLGVAFVLRALLFTTAPSLSDDVFRYVWDGRVQNAGFNPYMYAPIAPELSHLRDALHPFINHPAVHTIYPPLAQFVFRVGAALSPTVAMQKLTFTLFDLGGVAILLAILRARRKPAALAALYAWHPLAVVEVAGSGHFDSLMLFFLLAGCWAAERGKLVRASGLFGLATVSKWIPCLMAPWVFFRGRVKGTAAFGGVALLLSVPFAVGFLNKVQAVAPAASGVKTFARDWIFNPSLYGLVGAAVANPTTRRVVIGVGLVIFALWWASRNADPVRYAHGALFALLLASPVVHPWYVLWLLPFAVILGSAVSFLWAWAAAFSYVVQIRYATERVWDLPNWVPAFEYTLLYAALAWVGLRALRPARAATRALPPLPRPSVAVIIPALNEEKAIGLVISEIPKEFVTEVIVVDNGSKDRTAEVAAAAGARVIREDVRGYGRAVQTGLKNMSAGVDVVVILDGDRSDFPEELPRLLEPIREGRAELVIGSRTEAALPGSLMPQQRFGNWLTCVLLDFLYDHRFSDMGPFRAIRREAMDDMRMTDPNFGWNVEMQAKALRKGYRAVEVPVKYRPRIGQSKISGTLRGSFNAGRIILWAIWHYGVKGN